MEKTKQTMLEDLVPPLSLCKQIPQGEFENTVFQWQEAALKNGSNSVEIIPHYPLEWKHPEWAMLYPAPTVAEIMEKMYHCRLKHKGNIFFFERRNKAGAWAGGYNSAEIALQVWLKLKGIINE